VAAQRVRIGITTCPNDTFAFHALLTGAVAAEGLELSWTLGDIEELNRGLLEGRLDVAKASFHAALAAPASLLVLPSGAALGFGVGPLLLAPPAASRRQGAPPHVLCPGALTTATLLWRLFHPEPARLEQRHFARILPALARGEADLGVCIHEARFTYRAHGLELVEDLGETWERATGAPLPLGGLVARRELPGDVLGRVARAIRASLEWARAHREACLPTMRLHAQELADEVLWAHVELYVNEHTLELGALGRRALAELAARAGARGLVPQGTRALEVYSP